MKEDAPAPKAMTDEQLAAYLQEMERQAVSFRTSDLAEDQTTAIDFYEAKPFGDEEEGRSQVVVPVVQEVVDYMTVSVLRTFVSGDQVVEFEAKEEDGEDSADEATEAVNHIFMREQDGYKVLHDWLKCGLIERICAVETACVEDQKRSRKTITVSDDELALMMEQGEPIIRATDNGDGSFQVTLEEVRKRKRYIDLPIPNYEFLFSPRTRHEDESEYLCHRPQKTMSDLIEMGFDRDLVESLAQDSMINIDEREDATWDDEAFKGQSDSIPGLRKFILRKEYARIDYDGDGVAELLRVYRVGNTILEAEEVEEQPFTVFCPFPRPHRMVGNSLADKVMDIQRNKSVVLRQNFDGLYLTNAPRWWVPEESTTGTTIDDLLTTGPGVLIRGRGQAPQALTQPFDVGRGMAVLEYLSGEQESRTGITRLNQGLDAEAMNKTATGMALQSSQGQQIEEFVSRNFAEALARLFVKKLKLMIAHGEPITMRVGGEYKQADPATWSDDLTVNVRVGLGSGKKEQRLAYRQMIVQLQAEAYANGTGLVTEKQLYSAAAGIVRDAGLGDPNNYFVDPDGQDFQKPEKADPETLKIQADMEMQARKHEAEVEKQRTDAVLKQQQNEYDLQAKREKAALDADLARQKADREYELAIQQQQREYELALVRIQSEREIGAMRAEQQGQISEDRPGGSLAE